MSLQAGLVGIVTLQAGPWLPVWLTPLWVLAAGVLLGLLLVLATFGLFALLSLIPPLGGLADRSNRAHATAAVLAVLAALGLGAAFWPQSDPQYRTMLILPMLALSVLIGWGVVFGIWRRTIREGWLMTTEGVFRYLFGTALVVVVLGLLMTPWIDDRRAILASIPDVNLLGDDTIDRPVTLEAAPLEIDPDDAPFQRVDIDYYRWRIAELEITTDRSIMIADAESPEDFTFTPRRIDPDAPYRWQLGDLEPPPLARDPERGLWIQNREIDPATVNFRFVTRPQVREASTVLATGGWFFLLIMGLVTLRQAAPRVWAIALATAKSEMAQPLYLVLLALGGVAILMFVIVPFNTLGEDIKVLKDSGMTLIMVLGLIQAVWSAGTSVSEEIEGRTALTVLSKPVTRRSFLIGKYLGIMLGVLVLFLILGLLLLAVTAYKPIYDAREGATEQPLWQMTHQEMTSVVPGLVLYFMETMAIGAIGVALATRLPMLANFVVCFAVYVIGNLTAPLVRSGVGNNELVGFVGKLIAVVVPNLNTFNIQSAVDAGNPIPLIYLAGTFNYLVCFGVMILMVGLLLFDDRDLA